MAAILGKKAGMTRIFDDKGTAIPVTVIEAGPCHVMLIRTVENDGYNALQLGYIDKRRSRIRRPELGTAKKAGVEPKQFVREHRTDDIAEVNVGDEVTVADFEDVKFIDIVGTTKGRGFQGVMRRWGFKGFPATHGTDRKHRAPGSIGTGSGLPGRAVRKGRKMGGHMGHVRRTVDRMPLLKVDVENNLLVVKGSVPGPVGGFLIVRTCKKMLTGSSKKEGK